jgi:hypothetical protein
MLNVLPQNKKFIEKGATVKLFIFFSKFTSEKILEELSHPPVWFGKASSLGGGVVFHF